MVRTFKTEAKFDYWWRQNLDKFGYIKALVEPHNPKFFKPFPDYWCLKIGGIMERVELELFPTSFIDHKHDINEVDVIICADDNRLFYPDFPPDINKKILICDNTRAIKKGIKCILELENRCQAYKEGNTKELFKALGWVNRKCFVCGRPIHKITEKVQKIHTGCCNKVISALDKDELRKFLNQKILK